MVQTSSTLLTPGRAVARCAAVFLSVLFACTGREPAAPLGPPVPPVPPPSPVVSRFTLEPDSLIAGAPFTFTYVAASDSGLAYSRVTYDPTPYTHFTDSVDEHGLTRDSETLVVPSLPTLVGARSATVRLEVAGPQGGVTTRIDTLFFLSSPQMGGFIQRPGPNPGAIPGDTVRFSMGAGAAQGIAWLGYAVGPPVNARDSVAVSGTNASHTFAVRVDSLWITGQLYLPSIGFFARDPLGNLGSFGPFQDLLVVSGPHRSAVTAPLHGNVHDVVIDTLRGMLYLSQPDSARVLRLSLATMTYESPIALDGWPYGLDLSLGGDSLLVCLYATQQLAIVNLLSGAVTKIPLTLQQGLGLGPDLVREAANRKVLISVRDPYGLGEIWEYNLNTGTQGRRVDADNPMTGMGAFGPLVRMGDQSRIALQPGGGSIEIYDAGTDSFLPRHGVGSNARLSLDAGNHHFLVGNRLWTSDFTWVADYATDTFLSVDASAIAADGASAFFASMYGYYRVRFSDGAVVEQVPVALPDADSRVFQWLLALPDNHTLLGVGANGVARIEIGTLALVRKR